MLNEAPKKHIDYSHPTRSQFFWRLQKELWRRMVTPFLMYFFMSLLLLALQAVNDSLLWLRIGGGILCILGGAFFNGHLLYNTGVMHYGVYVAGELHRRNELFGIPSGGDHRPEQEYRPWKGFVIGLYIGLPVIILGILAGRFYGSSTATWANIVLVMFAGWAIIPITWFGAAYNEEGVAVGMRVSPYFSILMVILPIVVSGVFYIVGAMRDKHRREEQNARAEKVAEVMHTAPERHEQTEEQRRNTLQSKKKKK